jgi:hypothetical protein
VGHRLLLSLPAVAAAIVAWALLGAGSGRVRYVQVLGGPTAAVSSLLVRCLELDRDGRVVPSARLALRATLASGDARMTLDGTTDAAGQLELRLGAGRALADPWLLVESTAPEAVLADGRLVLAPDAWRSAARRSGGWLSGQTRGGLGVRVAAESGTFAVPFESRLVVQVLAARAEPGLAAEVIDERPLADAQIEVTLDGAALTEPPAPSDARGVSRVRLRPEEHAVSARVLARAADRQGEWYGVLPVTPGALLATLDGDSISVRSPIVRERAYASIVTWNERIGGGIVPLTPADDGSASGRLELDRALLERIGREPSWVVVSSEHDKRSAGAVGWPLRPPELEPDTPRLTFDVADAVLLDGRAGAKEAAERELSGRRRGAALGLLAVGVLMAVSFWKEVRRERSATSTRGDTTPLAPGGWVLAVALACILLGLGGLAYFGLTH